MANTQIWAHRGASAYAPENTLEAFALAHRMGADGIELDVHLSADGELIVAHDETLDRCCASTGRIVDLTLAQLQQCDASNRKAGYRGVRIPTLREVYDLIKPTNMVINVEIKSGVILYEGIEQKCIELAKEMGMRERVYYSSFNHYALALLRALDSSAPIAPLYGEGLFEPWHYAKQLGAQAIHPHYATLVAPGFMQGLDDAGVLCNVWTVDDPDAISFCIRSGVNAVITNVPDVALRVRDEMGG